MEGTLFVIGDNLEQSFDSRVPEFGTVTLDMVRGKTSLLLVVIHSFAHHLQDSLTAAILFLAAASRPGSGDRICGGGFRA